MGEEPEGAARRLPMEMVGGGSAPLEQADTAERDEPPTPVQPPPRRRRALEELRVGESSGSDDPTPERNPSPNTRRAFLRREAPAQEAMDQIQQQACDKAHRAALEEEPQQDWQ
eukprot:10942348-Alexandrium_andersonii.AAC.1